MSQAFAVPSDSNKEKIPALSDELSAMLNDRVTSMIVSSPSIEHISFRAHFIDENDDNPRLTQMVASAILAVWWDLMGFPSQYDFNDNLKDLSFKSARYIPLNVILCSVARHVPNCGDYKHRQSVAVRLAEMIINNIRNLDLHGVSLVSFSDTITFNVKSIHTSGYKSEEIENTDSWYFMVMAP